MDGCPPGSSAGPGRNGSLFWLPRIVTQPKPMPYSTPNTAGRLNSDFGQVGFDFVEDRLAQAGGNVAGHNLGRSADGVPLAPQVLDEGHHPGGGRRVGTADDVRLAAGEFFDLFERDGFGVGDVGHDVAHLFHVADDAAPEGAGNQLFGDDAGGHADGRFAGARAAAAAIIAEAVLGVVRVVGVSGAIDVLDVFVVAAALVLVADEDGEARAGGAPLEQSGKDFRLIRLVALRDDFALAGPAAVEVDHQIVDRQLDAGRHAVDDDDISRPVALPGRRDAKGLSERIARHEFILADETDLGCPSGQRKSAPKIAARFKK